MIFTANATTRQLVSIFNPLGTHRMNKLKKEKEGKKKRLKQKFKNLEWQKKLQTVAYIDKGTIDENHCE